MLYCTVSVISCNEPKMPEMSCLGCVTDMITTTNPLIQTTNPLIQTTNPLIQDRTPHILSCCVNPVLCVVGRKFLLHGLSSGCFLGIARDPAWKQCCAGPHTPHIYLQTPLQHIPPHRPRGELQNPQLSYQQPLFQSACCQV